MHAPHPLQLPEHERLLSSTCLVEVALNWWHGDGAWMDLLLPSYTGVAFEALTCQCAAMPFGDCRDGFDIGHGVQDCKQV